MLRNVRRERTLSCRMGDARHCESGEDHTEAPSWEKIRNNKRRNRTAQEGTATHPPATHHALRVHQQQVLGLPALQAGEHVLARRGRAFPHQEVPVELQQGLGLPPVQLPVEPGLPSELLSHGH